MTDYQYVKFSVANHVGTLMMSNPNKLNAWTPKMDLEIRDVLRKVRDDDSVRVIVITGEGRGFCAGADMEVLQDAANVAAAGIDPEGSQDGSSMDDLVYLTRYPKAIVSAINGPAAGFGAAIAIFSDFRFIADNAKFTTMFARRGLIAEFGIAWMLARQVGIMNALDLLSARMVLGAEAGQMGFARALPLEGFLDHVIAFARNLAKHTSPRSFRVVKQQLYAGFEQTLEEARTLANDEAVKSFESEDYKEGIAHFLEKREPAFTGR